MALCQKQSAKSKTTGKGMFVLSFEQPGRDKHPCYIVLRLYFQKHTFFQGQRSVITGTPNAKLRRVSVLGGGVIGVYATISRQWCLAPRRRTSDTRQYGRVTTVAAHWAYFITMYFEFTLSSSPDSLRRRRSTTVAPGISCPLNHYALLEA